MYRLVMVTTAQGFIAVFGTGIPEEEMPAFIEKLELEQREQFRGEVPILDEFVAECLQSIANSDLDNEFRSVLTQIPAILQKRRAYVPGEEKVAILLMKRPTGRISAEIIFKERYHFPRAIAHAAELGNTFLGAIPIVPEELAAVFLEILQPSARGQEILSGALTLLARKVANLLKERA